MKDKINVLQKRIEEIENIIFYIDMVDHWTTDDIVARTKWEKELTKVKDLLIQAIAESVK